MENIISRTTQMISSLLKDDEIVEMSIIYDISKDSRFNFWCYQNQKVNFELRETCYSIYNYVLNQQNFDINYKLDYRIRISENEVAYRKSIFRKGMQLHRDNDFPAIEAKSGIKYWYNEGKLHRDNAEKDLPAVVHPDGYQRYYRNNLWDRLHGPATEFKNGDKLFAINGKLLKESEYKIRSKYVK